MNFFVGQFFSQGFMGVLVPGMEKKYEWMDDCQKLTGDDWVGQKTYQTPQGLRWTG